MLLLHCSFIVLLENSALFSQKRDFFFLQCRRMILCGMDNFHRLPCQNQTKQLQTRVPLVLKFSQIFDPFLLEKFAKKKCISRFTVVKLFSLCSRLTAWVDLDIYVFLNNVTNFKRVNNINCLETRRGRLCPPQYYCPPHCVLNGVLRKHFLGIKMQQ